MLIYFQPNDEDQLVPAVAPPPIVDDDFWAGALTSVATIALAASLAVSAISTTVSHGHDDSVSFAPPEEDFGAPYQIVPEPVQQILIFLDDGSSPTAFQPDEDYATSQIVRVAPIGSYPVPIVFTYDDVIGTLPNFIQTDEDFWQNSVAPVPSSFGRLYLPDPEEIPAGSLVGPPPANPIDEYWQNQVAPVPPSLYIQYPYITDPEELPAHTLSGQPDEDYWQNPTAPVPAILFQRLPFGSIADQEEIPASLFGQPDEDFWQNAVRPVPGTNYQPLPYLPDPEELPVAAFGGTIEEDFWQNPVAPVYSYSTPKFFTDDDITIFGLEDEFWQNPVAPVPFYPVPLVFIADDTTEIIPPIEDEDYWQNPTAPVPATNYQRLPYLPDPEEIPAGNLVGPVFVAPDEDFWMNPVRPVPMTFGPVYLPDPDINLFFYVPLVVLGSGKITRVTGVGRIT